ncbi:hypothetical protein ColLi_13129 [Colletotrichum liriopes]|uniref:Uncharacterized protein n=1 Tax=Colletotrichum liriopes TaxID=708192 RepID=A0AA37H1L1_9PEZI|nr:hypothetical protein ColLi_13129 [Colletotrichum liriopes]
MAQLRLHSFLADRLNLAIITASADVIPLIYYMREARVEIVIDVASRANFGDCNPRVVARVTYSHAHTKAEVAAKCRRIVTDTAGYVRTAIAIKFPYSAAISSNRARQAQGVLRRYLDLT